MNWIFSHLQLVIFGIVLFSVVRAAINAAKQADQSKSAANESDEQRRVREIQERIRRKIAERRGAGAPIAPTLNQSPARTDDAPRIPSLRPASVPPLEPFGGPSRRLVIESMRRGSSVPVEEPPPIDPAEMARQRKLEQQIRALDEARATAERRAAQAVTQRENAAASSSAASAPAAIWLGDLRDPRALRRAFVMREVLGAPVALR